MQQFFTTGVTDQQINQLKTQHNGIIRKTSQWIGAWKGYEMTTKVLVIGKHKWVKDPDGYWYYAGTESMY